MADQEGRFEGVEEVAERLLVDPQTVRRWIKSGKLKAYKPGREYRILSQDLDAFLESRRSPKAPSSSSQVHKEADEELNPETLRREFQEHSDTLEHHLQAWEEAAAQLRARKVPYHDLWGLTVAYAASFLWKGLERDNVLDSLQPQGAFAEALADIEDLPEPLRKEVTRLYDAIGRLTRISGVVMEAEKTARDERSTGPAAELVNLAQWKAREKNLPPRPESATDAESA